MICDGCPDYPDWTLVVAAACTRQCCKKDCVDARGYRTSGRRAAISRVNTEDGRLLECPLHETRALELRSLHVRACRVSQALAARFFREWADAVSPFNQVPASPLLQPYVTPLEFAALIEGVNRGQQTLSVRSLEMEQALYPLRATGLTICYVRANRRRTRSVNTATKSRATARPSKVHFTIPLVTLTVDVAVPPLPKKKASSG